MATVEMSFTPLPAHVRTARLVATAVARRSGVDETLLDEVRLAVGEACSRAVEAHQLRCPHEPVRVALTGSRDRFEVTVSDCAAGGVDGQAAVAPTQAGASADGAPGREAPSVLPQELGLAVIAGLAEDVEIDRTAHGLSITMSWPSAAVASRVPGPAAD